MAPPASAVRMIGPPSFPTIADRKRGAASGGRLALAVAVGGEDLLGRDLDALPVEGDLEAGPELAGHRPLLQRAGLGDQADADAAGAELLDPPHLGVLQ